MNIIQKITLSHMKQNKKRTIVTLIGIILATAMMTAVFISYDAFNDLMIQNVYHRTGKWHFSFSDVPAKNALTFAKRTDIEASTLSSDIGFSKLSNTDNPDKPYIHLEGYTKESFSTLPIHLKKGRLPEKENELVISSHLNTNGGVSYSVGDTITLDIGERYSNQLVKDNQEAITLNKKTYYKLDKSIPYYTIQKEYLEDQTEKSSYKEIFQPNYKKTYTIVGVMERPNYTWEEYSAAGFTAITYLSDADISALETVNLRIYIPNNFNTFAEKKEISTEHGIVSYDISSTYLKELYGSNYDDTLISKNEDLLNYTGYSKSSGLNRLMVILEVILAIIIMIASISLIQSAFSISISERSRYLGMLASVGATKRQKRSSVYFEALCLGLLGIPLGILAGILGMTITFIFVSPIFSDLMKVDITLQAVPSFMSILFTIFFSVLTIFLSCWIPSKRASHITPLDAIRQTKDIKLTRRTVKTSKLSRFIFGLEGDLALKNMKRNKKRYRAVIFSLFISFVLFICVSGYCFYIKQSMNMYSTDTNYDMALSYYETENSTQTSTSIFNNILSLDNISESQVLKEISGSHFFSIENKNSYYSKEYKNIIENTLKLSMEDSFVEFISLNDDEFKNYAKNIGVEDTSLENSGIFVNNITIRDVYTWYSTKVLNETHSSIPISYMNYNYSNQGEETPTLNCFPITTITPIAYTNKFPLGVSNKLNTTDNFHLTIIISDSTLQKIEHSLISLQNKHSQENKDYDNFSFNITSKLFLKASNPEKLTDDLNKITDDTSNSYYIFNAYEENKMQNQLILLISIFSYGFIILMTAICTANIFNSITTGMALRKREFAMLQSIGMTPRSFYRSIAYESLLYGIKALIYGLPIGLLALYGIYKIMSDSFHEPFMIPIGSFVFGILFIFVVVGICMLYSIRKIKKENIIDTLKNENI